MRKLCCVVVRAARMACALVVLAGMAFWECEGSVMPNDGQTYCETNSNSCANDFGAGYTIVYGSWNAPYCARYDQHGDLMHISSAGGCVCLGPSYTGRICVAPGTTDWLVWSDADCGHSGIFLTIVGDGTAYTTCPPPDEPLQDNDPHRTGQETTEGEDWDSEPEHVDCNQNRGSADPVNLGTGATFFENPDLQPVRLPGETLSAALAFGRFQSSGNPSLSPLRGGWTHNYNVRLSVETNSVIITDWQGSRRAYSLTNGAYYGDGTASLTMTSGNFIWQLTHGTCYVFDGYRNYRLSNITDRVTSSVVLRYDDSNLLTGVVDSAGRQLTFSYNASNQLTSVVDPIGRTNSFACDALGRLNGVNDALGQRAQYVYGDDGLTNAITMLTNARGYTNAFAYNALGQAVAETNALGKVQTYDWVNTNQVVTVTQFDGTSYTIYNDATGAVTARVDAAGTQQYWRDDRHRATNTVDRLGHSTQYLFDTNVSVNGLSGNLLMRVDALERTNSWTYESTFNFPTSFTNAAGGATLWSYDNKGNVLTNTDAAGQVTIFGYDAAGNQTSVTDANQHTTTFGYDQYGNRTNATDALQHQTSFAYDLVGRLTGRTDALERSESFTFDDRDRLTCQINAAGETNTWSYDGNGNRAAWADPLGHTRTSSFDALDRLTTTTLPGDSAAFVTYGYDDANNRISVTDALGHTTTFGYDALGRLTSTTNALQKVWTFTVDAEGRRVQSSDPNQHSQSFVYDAVGQLTAWTNALAQVTAFSYDPLGNLTNVTDPRSNPMTFGYDAVSRLTDVTYAGGSSEQFFHDGVGNVTGIVTRAAQTIALTYDAANRLAQKSYVGTSDVVTYTYDDANQLTGVVAAVSGGNSVLAFAYDAAGRLTNETQTVGQAAPLAVGYEYHADGRRKKLIYPDGTFITYEYNPKGWLTAIKDGGTNTIVSYQYDDAGRRTQRTLENNTFTVYDYDNANQLTSIWHQRSSGGTNTVSRYQYGYDDAGNRTNKIAVGTAGSAVRSESYAYDAMDQIVGVTYTTDNMIERIVTYQYDDAGNRTNLVEIIGNATNFTSYAANSDNQLTSATATRQGLTVTGYVDPGTNSNKWYASVATSGGVSAGVSQQNGNFSLPGVPVSDGANALTVTVTDVSGNIATQIVNVTVVTGTTALGYDANGNQTNDATWSYTYDRENRLVSAASASLAVYYSYDALGRLIERRTSGASTTTNHMYYASGQLIAEYDGAGVLQRKCAYGPGVDEMVRMTNVGGVGSNYYYHADGLGSVTELTDGTGAKAESYTYDVYGVPTFYNSGGSVIGTSTLGNRMLFTARDRDPDTGWYNHRHRYYNPSLGRFVQPDPLRTKGGGANLYRYCDNRPINFKDPSGLCRSGSWSADDAYNYWVDVASRGIDQGGVLGDLEAWGASLMTSFIDFFNARGVENSAAQSGAAAGNGDIADALGYGSWTITQIGISALAGWTGGGGAAATEVKTLGQAGLYELGSQTINGEVFQLIKNMSPVERGQYLLNNYGWWKTISTTGPLRPTISDWLLTLPQGPTPAGYLLMMGARQGIQSSQP